MSTNVHGRNAQKMYPPPTFARMNAVVQNLFDIGFYSNLVKLNVTSTSTTGVRFLTTGQMNLDNQKTLGALETVYKRADNGISFRERWDTDNVITSEITLSDQVLTKSGLSLSLKASFSPLSGERTSSLKTNYATNSWNCASGFEIQQKQGDPMLVGSAVTCKPSGIGRGLWLFGCSYAYNTAKSTLTKSSLTLGYDAEDFSMRTNFNNGSDVIASLVHRISKDVQYGVQLKWNTNISSTSLSMVANYDFDDALGLKVKLSSLRHLGISCRHVLRPGFTLTLSSTLDCLNLNQGTHKLGFGVDLQC